MESALNIILAVCEICSVLSYVCCGLCGDRVNLAFRKLATQSSTHVASNGVPGSANLAVDGIRDPNFNGCNSCTHTKHETNPWWMVDLGQIYKVNEVVLSNRAENHGKRLRKFKIELSKSANGKHLIDPVVCASRTDSQPEGATVSYPCIGGETSARYVRIQVMYRTSFYLCEVQVFGPDSPPADSSCQNDFALTTVDKSPKSIAIATTTTRSLSECSIKCGKTEFCTSFTVEQLNSIEIRCGLYECKPHAFMKETPGTLYYVLQSVVNFS